MTRNAHRLLLDSNIGYTVEPGSKHAFLGQKLMFCALPSKAIMQQRQQQWASMPFVSVGGA